MIIGGGEPAVIEEAAERLPLTDGVAEGGGDKAADILDASELALGPGEEVVGERSCLKLPAFMPLLRRETCPLFLQLEDGAKAEEPFARPYVFGDGRSSQNRRLQ